jgi:hypothetical protein
MVLIRRSPIPIAVRFMIGAAVEFDAEEVDTAEA